MMALLSVGCCSQMSQAPDWLLGYLNYSENGEYSVLNNTLILGKSQKAYYILIQVMIRVKLLNSVTKQPPQYSRACA